MKRFLLSLTIWLCVTAWFSLAQNTPDLIEAPFQQTWRTPTPNSSKRPWSQKITILSNATNTSILIAAEAPSFLFYPDHAVSNRFYFCAELEAPSSRQTGWFGLSANILGNGPLYFFEVRPNPLGYGADGLRFVSEAGNKTEIIFSTTIDLPDRKSFILEWTRPDPTNFHLAVLSGGTRLFSKDVQTRGESLSGFLGLCNHSASQSSNEWKHIWIAKDKPDKTPLPDNRPAPVSNVSSPGQMLKTAQIKTNQIISNEAPQLIAWERRGSRRLSSNDHWTLQFDRPVEAASVQLLFKRKDTVFFKITGETLRNPDIEINFVPPVFPETMPRTEYEVFWRFGDNVESKLSDFHYAESLPKRPSLVLNGSVSNKGLYLSDENIFLERDPREQLSTSFPIQSMRMLPPLKSDWIFFRYERFVTDTLSEDDASSFPDLDDSAEEWCRLHPQLYFAIKLPAPDRQEVETYIRRLGRLAKHVSQKAYRSRFLGFVFEWTADLEATNYSLFANTVSETDWPKKLCGIELGQSTISSADTSLKNLESESLLSFARDARFNIFFLSTELVKVKSYPFLDLSPTWLPALQRDKLVLMADVPSAVERSVTAKTLELPPDPFWNRDEFYFSILRREIARSLLSGFPGEPKEIDAFLDDLVSAFPIKKEIKAREKTRAKRLLSFSLNQRSESTPEVQYVLDSHSPFSPSATSNQWALNLAGLSWSALAEGEVVPSPAVFFQTPPSEEAGRIILEKALTSVRTQAFIFTDYGDPSEERQIQKYKIKNLNFFTANRPFVTPEELNQIYRDAGFRPFLPGGDEMLFRGPWILLHTRESGTKECQFPRDWREVTEVFTGRVYPVLDGKFECQILAPSTCLFFKGQWKDNPYASKP